jgi:hypothetical protein
MQSTFGVPIVAVFEDYESEYGESDQRQYQLKSIGR